MSQSLGRRSVRLAAYDYRSPGSYFVTVCTSNRSLLFEDAALRQIVESIWASIPEHHPNAQLDVFVVMPNHVHGILLLYHGGGPGVGAQRAAPLRRSALTTRPTESGSLPTVVRAFKSASTKAINDHRSTRGAAIWQRNYYEHIIRDERELHRIREYIASNPANWHHDLENPYRDVSAEFEKAWSWLERSGARL